MPNTFMLTIDAHPYSCKPNRSETGRITERLKAAKPMELTPERFCKAVGMGCTWVGGVFGSDLNKDTFVSQQIFAIDIDNGSKINGEKVYLHEGEPGFLNAIDALDRCYQLGLSPLCIYFTLSASIDNPRFRIVFDMGEPITDREEAEEILLDLLDAFPEGDTACKNVNRLYFGSCGEVWETWRMQGGSND